MAFLAFGVGIANFIVILHLYLENQLFCDDGSPAIMVLGLFMLVSEWWIIALPACSGVMLLPKDWKTGIDYTDIVSVRQ